MKKTSVVAASMLLALASAPIEASADPQVRVQAAPAAVADRAYVDQVLAGWPARPRLAAYRTIDKYGLPQEATPMRLVWHDNAPWKRTVVLGKEIPHAFPRLHMDFIVQTIDYHVPADKSDELIAFDGSVLIDRTAGELSARCDMEEANTLTFNLAHDIVTGEKDADAARQAFGRAEVEFLLGKPPAIMTALRFKSPERSADPDKPVIEGSPLPPQGGAARTADDSKGMSDAEILAFVVAIDLNEIMAASDAVKEKINPQTLHFARMLHEEHGQNLDTALKLAQRLKVTPLETPAVEKLQVEAAANLAGLVRLEGEAFAAAYVGLMAAEHAKVLALIDSQLLAGARDEGLKEHLQATRGAVAKHLEEARRLQANPGR
jgi:predicted outer membrane protein